MSPILAVLAVTVAVGAVVGVSAREARAALVGVAVVLVASPFLADPLPPLPTLAMRVVGAALAAYLVRAAIASAADETVALGREQGSSGARTGWPTQGLYAVAAAIVGIVASANLAVLKAGSPGLQGAVLAGALTAASMATAAGLVVVTVAVVPAILARNAVRTIVAFVLLIQGIVLVRTGVAGLPGDLEQLAGLVLTLAAAATGAIVIRLVSSADPEESTPGDGRPRSRSTRQGAPTTEPPRRETKRAPVPEPAGSGGEREGDAR